MHFSELNRGYPQVGDLNGKRGRSVLPPSSPLNCTRSPVIGRLPEELKQEYHVDLTFEIKRKILGENAARLYGIDIPAQTVKLSRDRISDGG